MSAPERIDPSTTDQAGSSVAVVSPARNEVVLVGRVAAAPESRELPSGDVLLTLRLVVDRPEDSAARAASRSRQRVDTLDCAVWSARLRRSVSSWRQGDWAEVHGAVRRRFYKTPAGAASRVEIEVTRARVIRRAAT